MFHIFVDFANAVGMVGVFITLLAYFLLNINKMSSEDMHYLLMNFIGSSLVLMSLLVYWNISAIILESAWALVSLLGIYRVLQKTE